LLPLHVVLAVARGCARPFGELDLDVPGSESTALAPNTPTWASTGRKTY
jgi:hypothetical protein